MSETENMPEMPRLIKIAGHPMVVSMPSELFKDGFYLPSEVAKLEAYCTQQTEKIQEIEEDLNTELSMKDFYIQKITMLEKQVNKLEEEKREVVVKYKNMKDSSVTIMNRMKSVLSYIRSIYMEDLWALEMAIDQFLSTQEKGVSDDK